MRKAFTSAITLILLLGAVPTLTAQKMADSGPKCNVIVRFNGGGDNNKVYIGEKNTLEILIDNPDTLQSISMGFGFISKAKDFKIVDGYGDVSGAAAGNKGILKDHVGAAKCFNMGGVLVNDSGLPYQILIGGVSTPGPRFPASDGPRVVFSMQIEIPKDAKAAKDGFCIDNIFVPPGGTWEFNGGGNEIVPLFNDEVNKSTRQPSAPSVCFDLVKR